VIRFIPVLESLNLLENKNEKNTLANYTSYVLYITKDRILENSDRSKGLLELDGNLVKTKDRIQAVESNTKRNKKGRLEYGSYAWETQLINQFGLKSFQNAKFLANVKSLVLPDCGLTFVSLAAFKSLEFLDLSANYLTKIDELETCSGLRLLNLNGNLKLDLGDTLKRISNLEHLEQVSFCVMSIRKHKLFIEDKRYRKCVLSALCEKKSSIELGR